MGGTGDEMRCGECDDGVRGRCEGDWVEAFAPGEEEGGREEEEEEERAAALPRAGPR